MSTRSIAFTADELRLISIWANNVRHDLDQERILQRPDSPKEKAIEADMREVEVIMAKLGGRESVPSSR